MQFRILGPLEARTSDGVAVRLGAEKQRRLLAMLLLSANEWVRVDALIESVWTDPPPRSVHSALRTYVSGLRGALRLTGSDQAAEQASAQIEARRGAYRMAVDPGELDLLVFRDLADRGRAALADGDLTGAARRLEQALDLWRGPALEDVGLDPGTDPRLVGLAESRVTVLEQWVEAKLALHEPAEAVAAVRPFVADHPLRERLLGWWMLALYQSGRQSEALESYRALRERLVRDLGIEPDPELRQLHRRMLAADPALDPAPVVARAPAPLVPRQLPPDVAGFTGRAPELARIEDAARTGADAAGPAIVTVHGAPGVGKSALAVHAAHRLVTRFPDGQLYADLGGGPASADPLAALSGFLRALGAPARDVGTLGEDAARFRSLTAGRALLVVLDNAADAAQVRWLLPAGPGSAVLITSRRVLTTITSVESIAVPVLPDADANRLLARVTVVARIAAEPDAVAQLIRLCGGLPLALRIAGARLAARPGWPVSRLVERLSGARVRLDELQAGDLDVRASFEVSLDALRASRDPVDRASGRAFALLGVLDAAQVDVAAAARLLDVDAPAAEAALERLVDAQLVTSPAPGRYGLTDLLHVFADECADRYLGRAGRAAALGRVLDHYAELVRRAERVLRPTGPPGHANGSGADHLERIEADFTAIARVVRRALGGSDPRPAIGVVRALSPFFETRGYWPEWIGLAQAVLEAAERTADLPALAQAHRDLGVAHDLLGNYPASTMHLDRSLDLFERLDDRPGRARVLTSLGVINHRQGRYRQAADCHRASLSIRRTLGDLRGMAVNLSNLGVTHQRTGDLVRSRACYHTALEMFRTLGDERAGAGVLTNLGVVAERQGDLAEALASHAEGLRLFRAVGDRLGEATGLENVGRVHRLLGRTAAALECQEAALRIVRQLGDRMRQAECLHELGRLRELAGDRGQARVYWRQALAVFSQLRVPEADEVRKLLATDP